MMTRLQDRFVRWLEYRRTMRTLRQLDCHMLADAGMTEDTMHQRAWDATAERMAGR